MIVEDKRNLFSIETNHQELNNIESTLITFEESQLYCDKLIKVQEGLGYIIYKGFNKKNPQIKYTVKIYSKESMGRYRLHRQISFEILLHQKLSDSTNILNLIGTFENKLEFCLVFEDFKEVFSTRSVNEFHSTRKIIFQILVGLIEINSQGFSICDLPYSSIVYTKNSSIKLFNLQYLTPHDSFFKLNNLINSQCLPPELLSQGKITQATDAWVFGMLVLRLSLGENIMTNWIKNTIDSSELVRRLIYFVPLSFAKLIVAGFSSIATNRPRLSTLLADRYYTACMITDTRLKKFVPEGIKTTILLMKVKNRLLKILKARRIRGKLASGSNKDFARHQRSNTLALTIRNHNQKRAKSKQFSMKVIKNKVRSNHRTVGNLSKQKSSKMGFENDDYKNDDVLTTSIDAVKVRVPKITHNPRTTKKTQESRRKIRGNSLETVSRTGWFSFLNINKIFGCFE